MTHDLPEEQLKKLLFKSSLELQTSLLDLESLLFLLFPVDKAQSNSAYIHTYCNSSILT